MRGFGNLDSSRDKTRKSASSLALNKTCNACSARPTAAIRRGKQRRDGELDKRQRNVYPSYVTTLSLPEQAGGGLRRVAGGVQGGTRGKGKWRRWTRGRKS